MMLSISLEEARGILGKEESVMLSDEQLEGLIQTMELLARETITAIREEKLRPREVDSNDPQNASP